MSDRVPDHGNPSGLRPISRSRLHNFTFLTSSWGTQRIMRRADSHSGPIAGGSRERSMDETSEKSKSLAESFEKEKSREKLCDVKKSVDGSSQKENSPDKSAMKEKSQDCADNSEIPWNLRKRRGFKAEASNGAVNGVKEGKRKTFSVSLTYKEIEADILIMKGKKPPRRPKKRPKNVQRQIDMCFPGMWLSEVTPDLYKVKEKD